MTDYYLKIETTGIDENDEILTIQYQQLDTKSGETEGDLIILKSWESSEKEILEKFFNKFDPLDLEHKFSFMPVGISLHFVFFMLHKRWDKYDIDVPLKNLFYEIPNFELKPFLVLLNDGKRKNSSLDIITGKKTDSTLIRTLYANKDYEGIEDLIIESSMDCINFYQHLKERFTLEQFL